MSIKWKIKSPPLVGEDPVLKDVGPITETANPFRNNKFRAMHSTIKPGFAWNPLAKYPPNMSCWCGSKVKAKKCCKPEIMHTVTEDTAKNINVLWEDVMLGRCTLPGIPKPPKKEDA